MRLGLIGRRGRPLNLAQAKIADLEDKKAKLSGYTVRKDELHEKKEALSTELEVKQVSLGMIRDLKTIKENDALEKEKINVKRKIADDYDKKVKKLEKILGPEKKELTKKEKRDRFLTLFVYPVLILLATFLINISNISGFINYGAIAGSIGYLAFVLVLLVKQKQDSIENKEERRKIKQEIDMVTGSKNEVLEDVKNLVLELETKNKKYYENVKNKYAKVEAQDFYLMLTKDLDEIRIKEEDERSRLDNINLELSGILLEEKTVIASLENKALYEEELSQAILEKEELLERQRVILLTKEILEVAYEKVKEEITPKFTKDLSALVNKISGGKYSNARFSDEHGLRVQLENGKYVDSKALSLGTIDQLYLSLRLSSIREISEEKIPMILDESFVYYDEERLENVLAHLSENCEEYQVIIFTCSEREKEAMQKLGLKYNYVEL